VLVCTAGDFYGSADVYNEAKSHFVARMMGTLGYDAVGIGEMDLGFGLAALVRDVREYRLPVVCANLYARADSVRVREKGDASRAADAMGTAFAPYRIVEKAGARFGFVGLISPATKVRTGAGGSGSGTVEALTYTLGDPIEAARKVIPEVRAACDVLVVLAHMDLTEAGQLLAALPDIDLVVLGHDPQNRPLGQPVTEGKTRIVRATAQGQYIGQLDIYLGPDHRVADAKHRLHLLGAEYAEDPAMAAELDRFDQENRRLQKELFAREQLRGASDSPFGTRYLGLGACQSCHVEEFEVYMTTRHAHAYETLSSEFVHRDSNCVGCHVTGWGEEGGFQGTRLRGSMVDLIDVQCEQCHGPGVNHARDGSYLESARTACVKCHTPNDDPEFDYDVYWPKIAH